MAKDMQNCELYQSLSDLTRKSLDIIGKSIDDNLVMITKSTWVKHSPNTYVREDIKRPFWGIVLQKAKDEITDTEEFAIVSRVAMSDPVISPQLDTQGCPIRC